MLDVAVKYIQYNPAIENRALALEQRGIRHFDALHLACAEYAGADFFVTCDDELIKKASIVENRSINVISLLEFIAREVF
jgi:predicted nucleic acid-binding protein